jgi:hypothetical protein
MPSVTADWADAAVNLDAGRVPLRLAQLAEGGWVAWWTDEDYIVEIQSAADQS